ncbi:hypothetical protein FRC11_001518 [Ceratobasidium sp. 423]|nr:hypothetical protein FRC11_001518 [Ceratobasidium sp. 423]
MSLAPGTYLIHDTNSGQVLTYYPGGTYPNKVGSWRNHKEVSHRAWHVKRFPGSSKYALQNVKYNKYIAIGAEGVNAPCGAEEDGAAVLELEHQFHDFYLIKMTGTKYRLEHPKIDVTSGGNIYTVMKFTDGEALQGCVWRFEKIDDDAGTPLQARPEASVTTPPVAPAVARPTPQPSNPLPPNSDSLYTDDAHFYTDLLFNMPRTPFTRTQRLAALDWARKLGGTNVPTIESFEECQRRWEAASRSNNNPARSE